MELDLSKYIHKRSPERYEASNENNNFENYVDNPNITTKCIKEYFDNCCIFVTGSTGFLGKVLIEKLLRSCEGISKIYILLRSKRGVGSEQRFQEYLRNSIFERIRSKNPALLNKLFCIPGDINDINLGLDEVGMKMLENVDIVFHIAATVRFNESLCTASNLNTFGTQRVMELCCKMKKLKSLVHVSTAYSNPYMKNVGEKVYGSKLSEEHQLFIHGVGILPDEFTETLSKRFKKNHPNTYTLTKSMAEQIVQDYNAKLPVCIVRPSIVTAAVKDPFPGWVDNVYGITGILMEIGRGTISSIMGNKKYVVDLVPVDLACNTLITAAWANSFMRVSTVPVYNCISGQINPLTWSELGEKIMKYARKNPTKYVALYPNYSYRTNRFTHWFYEIFLHFLPALLFDLILKMKGKRAIMLKISKRFKVAADTGEYFSMHEWNFETKNLKHIIRASNATQLDSNEFNCDISSLDWDDYMEKYMMGIIKVIGIIKSIRDKLKQEIMKESLAISPKVAL